MSLGHDGGVDDDAIDAAGLDDAAPAPGLDGGREQDRHTSLPDSLPPVQKAGGANGRVCLQVALNA